MQSTRRGSRWRPAARHCRPLWPVNTGNDASGAGTVNVECAERLHQLDGGGGGGDGVHALAAKALLAQLLLLLGVGLSRRLQLALLLGLELLWRRALRLGRRRGNGRGNDGRGSDRLRGRMRHALQRLDGRIEFCAA